ncbi:MAG TPA: energy transducer TonB [Blastocatellia bacterium]|nr:energy transducer TonB [Blastocatellia bacterium]
MIIFAAGVARNLSEEVSPNVVRIAVVGLLGNAGASTETTISASLAPDKRARIIDQAQLRPALAAIGYDGSINMTTEDARRLGTAIGCDFFITGKAEVIARSEREGETHQESIIGVMMVDGRSGALSLFDFVNEKAATAEQAIEKSKAAIKARAADYINRLIDIRAAQSAPPRQPATSNDERIEDLPDSESPLAAGFKPPEFINRVKPEYTSQAELADISATVEARALFKSDGQVGDIEIFRWAGFGLDESAVSAIRKLQFKPATRDGRPVSVRATVRYNFRRVQAKE